MSVNSIDQQSNDFIIFPNPSKSSLSSIFIKHNNSSLNKFDVKVTNIGGQMLFEKFNCKSMEPITFGNNLSKGIYFVTIMDNNVMATKKLVVN